MKTLLKFLFILTISVFSGWSLLNDSDRINEMRNGFDRIRNFYHRITKSEPGLSRARIARETNRPEAASLARIETARIHMDTTLTIFISSQDNISPKIDTFQSELKAGQLNQLKLAAALKTIHQQMQLQSRIHEEEQMLSSTLTPRTEDSSSDWTMPCPRL